MPEGDALHRAARRLQPLVGEQVEVETPNPRAQIGGIADKLDGRRLLSVEAVGKNLLFRFEGGYVLRSHLRMNGRWTLVPRGAELRGRPWLVLRGSKVEARQWNGPVLELHARGIPRLGPDILERPPRLDEMAARIRRGDGGRAVGDAILDQRLVAGIGNKWKAEALWEAQVSPWRAVSETLGRAAALRPRRSRPAHARLARRSPAPEPRLPPGRPPVPALRRADPLARPGRRQPDRVLVSRVASL